MMTFARRNEPTPNDPLADLRDALSEASALATELQQEGAVRQGPENFRAKVDSIVSQSAEWLSRNGIHNFEKVLTEPGTTIHTPHFVLQFSSDGDNEFAKGAAECRRVGCKLVYDPLFLLLEGRIMASFDHAKSGFERILLSHDEIFNLRPGSVFRHEFTHAELRSMLFNGVDSIYHGSFSAYPDFPHDLGEYSKRCDLGELAAFSNEMSTGLLSALIEPDRNLRFKAISGLAGTAAYVKSLSRMMTDGLIPATFQILDSFPESASRGDLALRKKHPYEINLEIRPPELPLVERLKHKPQHLRILRQDSESEVPFAEPCARVIIGGPNGTGIASFLIFNRALVAKVDRLIEVAAKTSSPQDILSRSEYEDIRDAACGRAMRLQSSVASLVVSTISIKDLMKDPSPDEIERLAKSFEIRLASE